MLYLWVGTECPNKHIAEYDREQSPNRFLLLNGNKLSVEEYGQCYVYARSSLKDMADDPFIRMQLRPSLRYAYIVTPEEMFFCAGGLVSKINVNSEKLQKIKNTLSITDDMDEDPKILSDAQLANLREFVPYPQFRRIPLFSLPVTTSEIEKKYDCIHNNSGSPLINQKIIDILHKIAPDDVQFLDTEIHCKDGVLKNYKLLNFTKKVIGIDRENSVLTMMKQAPDLISGFRYLTYKPSCMGNHKLARDAEYSAHILMTEEVKNAFEKEKIKGVWCVTPEEYCHLLYGT